MPQKWLSPNSRSPNSPPSPVSPTCTNGPPPPRPPSDSRKTKLTSPSPPAPSSMPSRNSSKPVPNGPAPPRSSTTPSESSTCRPFRRLRGFFLNSSIPLHSPSSALPMNPGKQLTANVGFGWRRSLPRAPPSGLLEAQHHDYKQLTPVF